MASHTRSVRGVASLLGLRRGMSPVGRFWRAFGTNVDGHCKAALRYWRRLIDGDL
jgi:hypothetical protein